MNTFKIITNTTADLPAEYLKDNDLGLVVFNYTIAGESYGKDRELDVKDFYSLMRQEQMPTTSQVNPEDCREVFRTCLTESPELLYLSFSSGLSGTINNARLAAAELMEENPGCRIRVIDTKCASLGEGLLVHKAVQLRKAGSSMEETADWVENHLKNFVHLFTVDDLNHLYRGGRVSKAAAVVGTMINIKPVLHVDEEGHLIPIQKVRGRRKSLTTLVDVMGKKIGNYRDQNDIVFISHGDAPEDAQYVKEEVRRRFGIENFLIHPIGPTIGAHSGPGTVALFFIGEER